MQDYTLEPQDTRHRRRASGGPRGAFQPTPCEAETVLVTGATGTVGSVVTRVLAENGVAVRALSRRGLSPDPGAKGIDARAVDLRDAQAVAEALTGVQRVFLATPMEEDIAAVAARLLRQSPPVTGVFDLTGPEAPSNHDVAAVLSRVLGRPVDYLDTPPGETRATLHAAGLSPWLTDIVMELYEWSARGGAARASAQLSELLGRPPITSQRFATDHADAFR